MVVQRYFLKCPCYKLIDYIKMQFIINIGNVMFYERKLKDMKYVLLYPIIRLLHLKEFVVDNKLANLSNLKI